MTPKLQYNDLVEKMNSLNLSWSFTESEYATMNGSSKSTFKCKLHGEEWNNSTIRNVYNEKKMCSQCRKIKKQTNPQDREALFRSKGVELVRTTTDAKGIFKCLQNEQHAEWEERIQQVEVRSIGCYECHDKEQPTRSIITKDDILEKMQKLGYKITNDFKNSSSIGDFQCEKGHSWSTLINNVFSEKSGCPDCSKPTCEAYAILILETLLQKKFIKTRRVLPSGLELDGYNEELKLAVEYNGSQHYVENKSFFHNQEGSFESQLERDELKRKECNDLGITLIEIHYKKNTFGSILDYIKKKLTELKYEVAIDIDWDSVLRKFKHAFEKRLRQLEEIVQIAESKGGKCLSDIYIDRTHPMQFKCKVEEHPVFEKTPVDICRTWCNECAHNAPVSDKKVNDLLEQANMEFVEGSTRKDDKSNVLLRCKTVYQHVVEIKWSNLKQRPYCNKCRTLAVNVPIYQYDLNNRFIAKFNELADVAAAFPDMNRNMIKNVYLKKKLKTAYGYIWSILAPVNGKLREDKKYTLLEADFIEKQGLTFE